MCNMHFVPQKSVCFGIAAYNFIITLLMLGNNYSDVCWVKCCGDCGREMYYVSGLFIL